MLDVVLLLQFLSLALEDEFHFYDGVTVFLRQHRPVFLCKEFATTMEHLILSFKVLTWNNKSAQRAPIANE